MYDGTLERVAENKIERVTDPSEFKDSVLRIRFSFGTIKCSTLLFPTQHVDYDSARPS